METFEPGDIVELKSGGPQMTVKGAFEYDTSQYDCQWFGGKKLEEGRFPGASLKRSA